MFGDRPRKGWKTMDIFDERKIRIEDAVLALDLDGTLVTNDKRVTEEAAAAVARFIDLGGTVVLASGRPAFGIRPVAERLQLGTRGGYVLGFNGGILLDYKADRELFSQTFKPGKLEVLCAQALENKVNLLTYRDGYVYAHDPEETYCQLELSITRMSVIPSNPLTKKVNFPVIKCLMTAPGEHLAQVEKKMAKYWEGKLNIVRSEPYFLEITELGINKGQSLLRLVEMIGKKPADLIACGDAFNDISMLQAAGIGVAMGNAQPLVKEAADFVTLTNEENGVVKVIERLTEAALA